MIENLPIWNCPNLKPAFNDLESATAVEMVYKLYGKNRELIDDYNKFLKDIQNEVTAFKESTNQDYGCFKEAITKICNDYIATMDMKIDCQDRKVADAIQYMKDNFVKTIKQLNENNELDNMIVEAISNVEQEINNNVNVLNNRVNNLAQLEEGSTTGDAELQDIRVGTDGYIYDSAGESVREQINDINNLLEKRIVSHSNNLIDSRECNGLTFDEVFNGINELSFKIAKNTSVTNGVTTVGRIFFEDGTRAEEGTWFAKDILGETIATHGINSSSEIFTEGERVTTVLYKFTDEQKALYTGKTIRCIYFGEYRSGVNTNTFYDDYSVEVETKIEQLESEINPPCIPEYWNEEIENKINEINTKINSYVKNDNDVALFFTVSDPHYPSHNYVTSKLMKYLSEKCGIRINLCLGDLITDSREGHADNLERIQDGMKELINSSDLVLITQGNHDNGAGIRDSDGELKSERIVYDKEWIHHTSSKIQTLQNIKFDDLGKAFYYDDELTKIRYISLDSFEGKVYNIEDGVITSWGWGSVSERQINWLINIALNIPDGYSVVTFSHLPIYHPLVNNGTTDVQITSASRMANGDLVLNAITTFITNGGSYIGHYCGHQHHDFLNVKDNVPQVINLNDGIHHRTADYFGDDFLFVGDAPTKTAKTTTECAFDVVIVNKTTKHVDLIRIGAGENREYNY